MSGGALPAGWRKCRLGDVVTLINGRAYSQHEMLDRGTPILRIQNLNGGNNWYYSDLSLPPEKYCRDGDLLYAWSATFGPYWWHGDNAIFHYHIWNVIPSERIDKNFAFYELMQITDDIKRAAHGVAMPHITKKSMEDWPISLPPLMEQRRIADKLDALLGRIEASRARLERVPALLRRFRQAVLAAATAGELTAEWREEHPDQAATDVMASQLSGFLAPDEYVDEALPTPWLSVPVGRLGSVFLGRQRSPENHSGPYMRPYVRAANVTWQGWDFNDVKEMNFNPSDFAKYRLQLGDVLVNEGSGSADEVGKPAIWRGEIENCCFQNTLLCVRPKLASSEYLYLVFLHAAMSKLFVGDTRGVNIFHIGKERFSAFPVPLPSPAEQQEIVRRVGELFSLAEAVQARYAAAWGRVERLPGAVLAKAFRGELG